AGCGSGAGQAVEYVPTWVEETVNVMKPTQVTEKYTAYKTECVPETVTKQVMVNKRVTETITVNKMVTERVPVQKTVTVNERVPVQKTVTVNETHWKNVQVTEMRSKTVHKTVQVQQVVEDKGGLFGTGIGAGLGSRMGGGGGGGLLGGLCHKK